MGCGGDILQKWRKPRCDAFNRDASSPLQVHVWSSHEDSDKNADQKSIDAISSETNALATAARNGTLDPGSLQGGTFTVTNLGAYGVDHFSAIINYPESAILSVGAARERAVVRNGEVVPGTTAYFGINCDHRIIDGAPAAEFLKTLKEMLEHPKVMPA